jgi:predicted transcriptional regulator
MAKSKNNQQVNLGQEIGVQLQRIEDLLTTLVKTQLSNVIKIELGQSDMKKLYAFTGNQTIREIEKEIKIPRTTISRIWQRWEQLGLLIKDGSTYRKVL